MKKQFRNSKWSPITEIFAAQAKQIFLKKVLDSYGPHYGLMVGQPTHGTTCIYQYFNTNILGFKNFCGYWVNFQH